MNNEKILLIKDILGPDFKFDYSSYFKKYALFSTDLHLITDEEMSNIIAKLISHNLFPRIQKTENKLIIHIAETVPQIKKARIWLHLTLFLLTILTTMMAGATLIGKDYFESFFNIFYGIRYSFAVIIILTLHEFGHYFAAKYHTINATLPYYIPLPLPGFHFGTLGAFIKIKSPIKNRKTLLDIGAIGPLAGFIASIVFLCIGYNNLPDRKGIIEFVETIHPWDIGDQGINIVMGKSLLFAFFNDFLAAGRLPMNEIYHFPYIFAGWIGLLITALNLMPIGQLDGGHILYALAGKKAKLVGVSSFALLILLNFVLIVQYWSFIWVMWVILIFIVIGFRHPPTLEDGLPLTQRSKVMGWICLGIFILCFPPLPIYIG